MTVAPTGPQLGLRQVARPSEGAPGQADGSPDLSFADLLWAQWDGEHLEFERAPPSSLPLQVDIRTFDPAYRADKSVADDAVRFDAKPVVAPAVYKESDAEFGASVAAGPGPIGSQQVSLQLPLDPVATGDLQDASHISGAGTRQVSPEGVVLSSDQVAERKIEPTRPTLAAGSHRFSEQREAVSDVGKPFAARLSGSPAAAVTRRLPASIAFLPTEVVVTLHGLSLTDAERDVLHANVQALLAERGLGSRAIRIQSGSRRTSPWP